MQLTFSRHLKLGANRRNELMEEFDQCAERVAEYLATCIRVNDSKQLGLTFKCIGSWFSIGDKFHREVVQKNLLHAAFHAIVDENTLSSLHELAADSVCSALYSCEVIKVFSEKEKDITEIMIFILGCRKTISFSKINI